MTLQTYLAALAEKSAGAGVYIFTEEIRVIAAMGREIEASRRLADVSRGHDVPWWDDQQVYDQARAATDAELAKLEASNGK